MKAGFFITVTFALLAIALPACAEPVEARLMGRVTVRNPASLDGQTKKELAAIAARIKKVRNIGAVKVVGDVPAAESQDEYLSKAVFIARHVEAYLSKLLSGRYQIFITAAKFSGQKRTGLNTVEILYYPHELKVEGAGFISSQVTAEELPKGTGSVQELPLLTIEQSAADAEPAARQQTDSGLLTPPPDDEDYSERTSKKERQKVETENPAAASDLVNRAKARAAEKARQLEREK